ncbi:hypothetical protein NIES25_09580 [Nostoc linckia NIES-25]|nr:hypothetical protein NIES25_09580 [Nostoc linckia NIES-25]
MSVHEETIAKIRQLPEPLLQQVNDFIDFLLMKNNNSLQSSWTEFTYKHLGKAGSPAHIDAVMQVPRRTQIQSLQSCIDSLRQSWADLYQGLLEKK